MSNELNKMKDSFDKIVYFQESVFIMSEYAGNKKRIGILREQHIEKTIQLEYFKKKERKTHDQT
ncbi:hypothetical protein [Bacillus pumilus]|uniref:hypothetical protein n=1 Tax=Bacillus pumilus TaxID=1408 RepID=UPI00119F892E|nr:hypothetical protein [Bacillus pumilus]